MQSLNDMLTMAEAGWPQAEIVCVGSSGPQVGTLGTLSARAAHVAGWLAAAGLGAGDRLAIQLPYCLENFALHFAAIRLGLVLVPIPQIYAQAELEFILRHSKARCLAMPLIWRDVDMIRRAERLRAATGLRAVIAIGDGAADPRVVPWSVVESAPPADLDHAGGAETIRAILYTSGTTADPKPVLHSNRTLCAIMQGVRDNYRAAHAQNFMACFPAGHVGGLIAMLRPLVCDATTAYLERWDAATALELIRRQRIGISFGGPYFLRSLLDAAGGKGLAPLELYVCGGANVPPVLIRDADTAGVCAVRSYGSTEHPLLTFCSQADALEKRCQCDGRVAPDNEFRLVDDAGMDVAPGESGEVLSRGTSRLEAYGDAALNEAAFTPDGWFRTGDIGRADAQGYLEIVDRKKDIIIRGGENISSMEVEALLCRHPAIHEAAVVAWPDALLGERVGAFVTLRPGLTIDLPMLAAYFAQQGVARQKVPERLVVLDELPRTISGKIIKPELRRRAILLNRESTDAA